MNKSAIIYFFLACFTVIIGNSGTSTAQINNSAEFETAKTRFAQGFVYFNEMKYLSASELFRQALYIYPEYHVSREYLARSYKMSGYFEESLTEWELLYKSAENPSVKNKIDNIRFFEAEISPPVSEEYLLKRKIISKEMNRFKFPYPSDMTIDSEKNIYISSFSSGKIVKLNSLFEGIDTKQFSTNSGIYGLAYNIDKNLIAATDFKNDKIYILNTDMKIIKEFGSSGSAPGQLHGPEGIAFNNKDYLYVADTGNSRIQKFSLNGDFIAEYGKKGKYNEMFSNPTSVTVYDNNVYVTDTDNSRVAIYDDYGNFLKI